MLTKLFPQPHPFLSWKKKSTKYYNNWYIWKFENRRYNAHYKVSSLTLKVQKRDQNHLANVSSFFSKMNLKWAVMHLIAFSSGSIFCFADKHEDGICNYSTYVYFDLTNIFVKQSTVSLSLSLSDTILKLSFCFCRIIPTCCTNFIYDDALKQCTGEYGYLVNL